MQKLCIIYSTIYIFIYVFVTEYFYPNPFSLFFSNIVALQEQRNASSSSSAAAAAESMEENLLNVQNAPLQPPAFVHEEFHIDSGTKAAPNIEHQFIPSFPPHQIGIFEKTNMPEEISVSLQLGEPEPKRRKQSGDENT